MSRDYPPLRSPRETIAGYILLPRLIDKIRLHVKGKLPKEYIENLLKPGLTLDGRFQNGSVAKKPREVPSNTDR